MISGFAAIALAFSTGAAHAQTTPAQHLLDSLRDAAGAPGFSAAVSRNGDIVWTGASGFADAENNIPVTGRTKFRLASVSKLFTAALVLKLADDGVVDLDADIRAYLPEWPEHEGGIVTLRRLAAHVSGIDHYSGEDRRRPASEYETMADSLSIFAHRTPLSAPGDAYRYSSYGYALMAAVVEAATGRSFDACMQDYILSPLALRDTQIEDISGLPENVSKLYSSGASPIARNDQRPMRGATGMLGAPVDLLKFASAYHDNAIVRSETKLMSWTPYMLNNGTTAGEDRYDVGFGWRIGRDWDDRSVVHHAGTTPGARSVLSLNPDTGVGVALLSNAQWVSRMETTGEMLASAATEGAALRKTDCPEGQWRYQGRFIENAEHPPNEDNAYGRVVISFSDDICSGALQPDGAVAEWLEARNARAPSISLTLAAKRNGDVKVFAMATPWGAFPLRMTAAADDGEMRGDIAGRIIAIALARTPRPQPLPIPAELR